MSRCQSNCVLYVCGAGDPTFFKLVLFSVFGDYLLPQIVKSMLMKITTMPAKTGSLVERIASKFVVYWNQTEEDKKLDLVLA